MDEVKDGKIPLGLCKQAFMKMESTLVDLNEIMEDEDLSQEQKETFEKISDVLALSMAHIINIIKEEIGEEDFLNENFDIDQIDDYPEQDILNTEIDE